MEIAGSVIAGIITAAIVGALLGLLHANHRIRQAIKELGSDK